MRVFFSFPFPFPLPPSPSVSAFPLSAFHFRVPPASF